MYLRRYFRSWALSTDINQCRLDRYTWRINTALISNVIICRAGETEVNYANTSTPRNSLDWGQDLVNRQACYVLMNGG
jgi:hypothetical protein